MSFITACSFVFNGVNSCDYGVIIGCIGSSDPDVSINGLSREIKKTTNPNRIKSNTYGTEHTDVITFNFSIVKIDGDEISRPESIKINQWLTSSHLPQKLKFNDDDTYPLHYYAVCTQIKDIIYGGKLVGKELTFETNSPFAFAEKSEKIFEITANATTFSLNNSADTDDGIYYPVITISTKSSEVVIENITDQKSVTINTQSIPPDNAGNKIIRLDSDKMIVSDKDNKLIPADKLGWNETIYWVRLLKGINKFKVTGDCILKIEYEYPRKAGCM